MMQKLFFALCVLLSAKAGAQTPQLVQDIRPGNGSSNPQYKTVFKNKLYFPATDDANGKELRSCDGNAVSLVYNINPGSTDGISSLQSAGMAVLNDKLYFAGDNGTSGIELMVYDGVNPPTVAYDLVPGAANSSPELITAIGGRLFFDALSPTSGRELYVFDGTNAPVLFDLNPGSSSGGGAYFTEFNGKVYFAGRNATVGFELFVYDPANNTTAVVADIEPGSGTSLPLPAGVLNNKLYFSANTTAYGYELYSYDGTSVVRLTDVTPGAGAGAIGTPHIYQNQVYFSGSTTGSNSQLYRYNPANGTASIVYNIYPGGSAAPEGFTTYKDKLYFSANAPGSGRELWVYDGTTASLAGDINPGAASSFPAYLKEFMGELYFSAETASTGMELYRLKDPAGLAEVVFNGSVVAKPNPATNEADLHLNLGSAQQLSVTLTDATGKVHWRRTQDFPAGESMLPLPMAALPAGMYFYAVSGNNSARTAGRILKK